MKFIHLADAHLDSPFLGLSFLPSESLKQIHSSLEQSLTKIVDLALKEQVDLVLLAGDIFDSPQPSPSSQLFLAKEIRRLTAKEIQVVMIFGNHDHMHKGDLLIRESPYFKLLGEDEKVEQVTYQTRTGFLYNVVGFSYVNNHIYQDKLAEFPNKNSNYTFGIMHAQQESTRPEQNVYAPFKLATLKSLNYDYFALGHIHARQRLSNEPLIAYSGNTQGRHINEEGAKGCYLGQINETDKKTTLTFVSTESIVWQSVTVKISQEISKSALEKIIVEELSEENKATYFSLVIYGAEFLTSDQIKLLKDHDFWLNISRQLKFGSQLVHVKFESNSRLEINSSDQEFFEKAKNNLFKEDHVKNLAKDWLNRDDETRKLVQDAYFWQEVEQLTEVELNNKLKGIK